MNPTPDLQIQPGEPPPPHHPLGSSTPPVHPTSIPNRPFSAKKTGSSTSTEILIAKHADTAKEYESISDFDGRIFARDICSF